MMTLPDYQGNLNRRITPHFKQGNLASMNGGFDGWPLIHSFIWSGTYE
jgi:hypothetical protein